MPNLLGYNTMSINQKGIKKEKAVMVNSLFQNLNVDVFKVFS
jgi:hypothetical protein